MAYYPKGYVQKIRSDSYFSETTCEYESCPLFQQCGQIASIGRKYFKRPIKLFFVLESPMSDDVEPPEGATATVGEAGRYWRKEWLEPLLKDAGAPSYLVSHLIRTPIQDNTEAARNAESYCWQHFWTEIQTYRPTTLVAFGASVYQQLYKRAKNKEALPNPNDYGVGKLRLKPLSLQLTDDYKATLFVGYAPGYILRSPASEAFFHQDRDRLINHFSPGKKDLSKPSIKVDNIECIDSVAGALEFINFLTHELPKDQMHDVAFDTETENLNRVFNNKFLSWQFSYKAGHAVFIPIEHPEKPIFADVQDKLKLIAAFQKLLNSSPEKTNIAWFIAHNAKFDLSILYGLYRILPRGTIPVWDTMLAMHWLDENRKSMGAVLDGKPYSLKTLGKEIFDFEYKSEALAARADGELVSLNFDDLVEYVGSDTILTWHLKQQQLVMAGQQPDAAAAKLERFMRYYFSPATRAVAFMECNGIHVSKDQLQYLQGESSPIWNRINKIENVELQNSPEVLSFKDKYRKIVCGEANVNYADDLWGDDDDRLDEKTKFNPNKKDQETAFYLEHLKLEPLTFSKKTNKASLNKAFLNHYAPQETYLALPEIKPHLNYYKTPNGQDEDGDPVFPKNPLQLILEYRELSKLGSTYLESISEMIENKKGDCLDRRVRASFWLSGTDTGRLASSDPNLQNLPSGRSPMAKEVKNLFQAEAPSKKFPDGTALIQLDYKTAEVRWAAIFANDKNLIHLFNDAREALIKACDPNCQMSDEEFEKTQLASDIHRRTASLMFGVPPEKVTKAMRSASKCLVGSTRLFTEKGIVPIASLVEDTVNDDNWLQAVNIGVGGLTASKAVTVNHKWVASTIRLDTKIGMDIEGDSAQELFVWQNCQLINKSMAMIEEGDLLVVPRTNQVWPTTSPLIGHCVDNEIDTELLDDTVTCQICKKCAGNIITHLKTAHEIDTATYRDLYPGHALVSDRQIANRLNSLLGTEYNPYVPKWPNKMNKELARLLGYLVSEGDGQRYSMAAHISEAKEMLDDFIYCVEQCFGLTLSIVPNRDLGVIRVPAKIVRYLVRLGLVVGYCETQRVPEIIFRSTKEEIVNFLCAYFEGDGCSKSNQVSAMSASPKLINDLQLLLLSLNIVSIKFTEMRETPVGKELRPYYGLRLSLRDARLFRDEVGFISSRKKDKLAKVSSTSACHDVIYGLETLLAELKLKYKRGRRWVVNGKHVRFGERITKGNTSEITHERLASRPYVLEALKTWSEYEENSVYADVLWLHQNHAALIPVVKKTVNYERTKVFDIQVKESHHTFIGNGFLCQNCITFGLTYGMGTDTLAVNNGWSIKEAEEKVKMFFAAFPDLKNWLQANPKRAKDKGYVETLMGRRRRLGFLFDTTFRNEAKAARLSMNAPIQGQSSDAGIIGLCQFLQYLLDNKLEKKWIIQNVVHDSVLVQVPFSDIEKALLAMQYHFVDGMAEYIKQYFDFTLPLPIECEIEVGLKYGDLTKWDGRPSTLPKLIAKLKEDAQKLWYAKKKDTGKPSKDMDLVKWYGES